MEVTLNEAATCWFLNDEVRLTAESPGPVDLNWGLLNDQEKRAILFALATNKIFSPDGSNILAQARKQINESIRVQSPVTTVKNNNVFVGPGAGANTAAVKSSEELLILSSSNIKKIKDTIDSIDNLDNLRILMSTETSDKKRKTVLVKLTERITALEKKQLLGPRPGVRNDNLTNSFINEIEEEAGEVITLVPSE